jgi:hypothetical protein
VVFSGQSGKPCPFEARFLQGEIPFEARFFEGEIGLKAR